MQTKIETLILNKKIEEIKKTLQNENSKDISILFKTMNSKDILIVFRILSKQKASEVFAYMSLEEKEKLIHSITDKELKKIINTLFTDDVVDLIEEMPASVVKRIFKNIKPENRNTINEFLSYPKNTAGTIMTNEFIDLKENMTAKEAFKHIKEKGKNKETIYTLYVLNETRKLIGILSIRELFFADEEIKIKDIMNKNFIYGETLEPKVSVSKKLQKYNFLTLPIVDKEKRLVGIVTIDDAIKTLQKDTNKNFQKLSAVRPTGEEYFKNNIFRHSRNRIIWLSILMFSAMITEIIISKYEKAVSFLPVLVSFIPLLMGTGGDSGTQASTLVVRGLATEEIKTKDLFKVLYKECKIALFMGTILATVNGVRIYFQYSNLNLAIVVGLALIITIVMANSMGAVLPIIAKKIKLDPAIMAAPLITTIIDIVAVIIYFNIAIWIMNI